MKKDNVINAATVEGAETVKQEGGIDTVDKKPYTFRKLGAHDTFLMCSILGKIGIDQFADAFGKDNVRQLMTGNVNVAGFVQQVGIGIVLSLASIILKNLHKCESEIYQLLSETSNLTLDEVKDLEMGTFLQMVVDFIKKPEFKGFIKVVSA